MSDSIFVKQVDAPKCRQRMEGVWWILVKARLCEGLNAHKTLNSLTQDLEND